MDNLNFNLINFALNMHSVKQSVASKNIAGVDFQTKLEADFSYHLNRLDKLSDAQKLTYLEVVNSLGTDIEKDVVSDTGRAINIESEHAESTKAMLEYQALIEAVNRKLSMMTLVAGGQR